MTRRATAEDVATEAGVSRWTVNRAYVPGSNISERSRRRVMDAAERLGYRPNLLARSLNTKVTGQVAVLVDDFANPYKLPALEKLTAALQAEDMVAMLIHIGQHYDHARAFLHADQRQVDSIVLLGTGFQDDSLHEALRAGGPSVFVLARESTHPDIPSVACDPEVSMAAIVGHLAERGYKRPGYMSGARALSSSLGRQKYFNHYWLQHGVQTMPVLAAGAYDYHAAERVLRDYLRSTPASDRIDVLMCENDVLAMGAYDVAQRGFGLRIPEDLAIVGYDGMDIVKMPMFDITTYEQPMDEMVAVLVDMLQGRSLAQSVLLPGRLDVRGST
jgi:LacI family transcriptional regulator